VSTTTTIGKLRIHFGGLCMFVQRPEGLFVLMPDMTMHDERHWPVMIVPPQNTRVFQPEDAKPILYPLLRRAIDELKSIVPPQDPVNIDFALNVSEFAGGARVADRWIADPPQDMLACRVSLPLGCGPTGEGGDPGSVEVESWSIPVSVRSLSRVELDLSHLKREYLQLDRATLYPGPREDGHSVDVYIYNIRLAELPIGETPDSPTRTHWKGQEIHHPRAYYDLLELAETYTPPRFFVEKGQLGDGTADTLLQDLQCPACPVALNNFFPPNDVHPFVDTHDCSHGQGI